MAGRRLCDHEFLSVLAEPGPRPGWGLDQEGRFLLLPLAERDLAWVLEPAARTQRASTTCLATARPCCSPASATSTSPATSSSDRRHAPNRGTRGVVTAATRGSLAATAVEPNVRARHAVPG
jgi:hypothetical protein